jgi:alginate O-acetyltransferase complex protein AlgJ
MDIFNKTTCILLLIFNISNAVPYIDLVPGFNRMKSNAMVRRISVPTLANLDYAAYTSNPVLFEKQNFKPEKPAQTITVASITFGGLLADPVPEMNRTPLTKDEIENPLSWRPLNKRLWEVVKDQGFAAVTASINGYKWADSSIYFPYQEIVSAYIHKKGNENQIWVKIEFSPWVKFISDAHDSDNDGFKEMYGRLVLEKIPHSILDSACSWIQDEYMTKVLNSEETVDWITELASYWYPSKNTDVLESDSVWPDLLTEKSIIKTMRGVKIKNPVAVVRGRPFGKPVYNVYIVDNVEVEHVSSQSNKPAKIERTQVDSTSITFITEKKGQLQAEVKQYGDYKSWFATLTSFGDKQKKFLNSLPSGQMGYEGKDGWLFFKKDLEYGTGGDLADQPYEKNPVAHLAELKKILDKQNISFLFVTVPNKTQVYFEKLPFDSPSNPLTIVNPFERKFLNDLQDSGIEVIDLLPIFLKAKTEDSLNTESVYQKHDTHWTTRGLQITAELIAKRIKAYSWYPDASKSKIEFTGTDTVTVRQGDIVERLPEQLRVKYPPVELKAHQIKNPDGSLSKSSKDAPIILMGDSFTGVFESVDCKSAGVGSNIAEKTGLPIDIITSWGGGPLVREKFIRQRHETLGSKKLVIYMMVARDLYNYEQLWSPLHLQ